MKKTNTKLFILIALFHLFSTVLFASGEFLNSGIRWTVLSEIENYFGEECQLCTILLTSSYKVEGDSIVEEKSYKKIFKAEDRAQKNWEFDCLMREEGKKVYILQQSRPEYLLYDFGLTIDESMEAFDGNLNTHSYIDEIEDTIINGVNRKIYSISMSSEDTQKFPSDEKWIEGIGSTYGLKRHPCMFYTGCYASTTLLCVAQDGKEIYHSPEFEECYYSSFGPKYEYEQLVNTKSLWSYCDVWRTGLNTYNLNYSRLIFQGDTIINDIKYQKLYSFNCESELYVAALREENKKVYAIRKGRDEDVETLIYDFNLSVGECFQYSEFECYEVMEIDYIEIDGKLRKQFNLGNYDTWIEGVGSLNRRLPNPLDAYPLYDLGFFLNYQKLDGKITYKTDQFFFSENDCPYLGLNHVNREKIDFNIEKNSFIVDKELISDSYLFELIDLTGKILLQEVIDKNKNTVNLQSVTSGVYLFRFSQKGQIIYSEKLLLKN